MEGRDIALEKARAEQTGVIACWSCKGPVARVNPLCETCGAVQPPGQLNHFLRLGLAASFDIDVAALDQLYFNLQRRLHPDRFVTRSPKEKAISQLQATAINDAYETLKEPLRRADYLVHLRGMAVLPEGCNLINDQELLIESMELREAFGDMTHVEVAVFALASALGEELFFRGAMLPAFGLIASSLIFGFAHGFFQARYRVWGLLAVAIGLGFGAVTLATGTIVAATVAHATINYVGLLDLVPGPPQRPSPGE